MFLFWNFCGWKMYFLSQKVDGKMVFTDYWKVLVLKFSVMGNMIFLESRSWWKKWYLLITKKFLFWTFQWWEIRSFFGSRSWWKDIFTGYQEVLVLNFLVIGNMIFFSVKKLMESWYWLGPFELSRIFQDLGNTVGCAVKKLFCCLDSPWNDYWWDIFLIMKNKFQKYYEHLF